MISNTPLLALFALLAQTIWCLPAFSVPRDFILPTCGMEQCLPDTYGLFGPCYTNDLACLCKGSQDDINKFVNTVQPCLDGEVGKAECTAGAIYQYKGLLSAVCAGNDFDNKVVQWASM